MRIQRNKVIDNGAICSMTLVLFSFQVPVLVGNCPGFVANRLGMTYMSEVNGFSLPFSCKFTLCL